MHAAETVSILLPARLTHLHSCCECRERDNTRLVKSLLLGIFHFDPGHAALAWACLLCYQGIFAYGFQMFAAEVDDEGRDRKRSIIGSGSGSNHFLSVFFFLYW